MVKRVALQVPMIKICICSRKSTNNELISLEFLVCKREFATILVCHDHSGIVLRL